MIGLPIGLKPSEGFTISSILGPFASRSQGAPPITGEAVPLGQYGCTKIPSEPSGPGARDRWKSCRNPTRDNVATEKRHCRIGLKSEGRRFKSCPATMQSLPGGHVASGLFRARSRCRTERGDAPRRRPGNSVLWIHIPSSYQAPDRCDRSLDSAPLALLINPNPINVSEDVGGETNRSPGATGSRSHGRRVQTLCSDRCSLDSPPLPVAFWVATMCLTLFLLPARPASIPSCADAPRTSGFRRRTAGGTRCGGTVLLAPRLARPAPRR